MSVDTATEIGPILIFVLERLHKGGNAVLKGCTGDEMLF
jgi:hypothetical protein